MTKAGAPSLVLTMIVKNEAHVIERCIDSLRPIIDAWCIVDTGSTDGTQDVVRAALASLPGALYEIPWQDFAYNRSKALELAAEHGDFALMIDADTVGVIEPGFDQRAFRKKLETGDMFDVMIHHFGIEFARPAITSTKLPFRYRGVVHEYVVFPEGATHGGAVKGFHFSSYQDGARSKSAKKFLDDALALERALPDCEPDLRPRYLFYLGQCYRDAGMPERALAEYLRRAQLAEGYVEERFIAYLACGNIARELGHPLAEVLDYFLLAYDLVPWRAESLCQAARVARESGRMPSAYAFAATGLRIAKPDVALFLDPDVYDWRLDYEFSIAAYYTGDLEEGRRAAERVLAHPRVPEAERAAVERNMGFYPSPVAG